jgi:pyridoxamine 5'-phosphate oxidase
MDINEKLQNLRASYLKASLDIGDCNPDPLKQFSHWLHEALNAGCDEPNAFTLSTVSNSKPRGRVLLLKGIEDGKFIFYTNYESSKGLELKENPYGAMTFLWLPLQRQVRIEGKVTKVEESKSDAYFKIRPRGSQIGAVASPQSRKISTRRELEALFQDAEAKYEGRDLIDRPVHWGGYALEPYYIEFWQGRNNRMHDRIAYEMMSGEWELGRLAP